MSQVYSTRVYNREADNNPLWLTLRARGCSKTKHIVRVSKNASLLQRRWDQPHFDHWK